MAFDMVYHSVRYYSVRDITDIYVMKNMIKG